VSSFVLTADGVENADAPSIWPPSIEWAGESLDDLEQTIYTSLYSDARVKQSELPPGDFDRKGWWGDSPAIVEVPGDTWGSKLWLAQRAKLTSDPNVPGVRLVEIKRWAAEALQWLVTDGVVSSLEVHTERQGNRAVLQVTVVRERNDQPESYWFDALWEDRR
jgi:phage gp46-like protein